jgi:hypothetical protein|tara:strand:- start:45 stop:722 length:678 start_codon:yes stop_codon:yes gene_type:complete
MNTFTTGSNDITTPPFEHKVILEKTYTNEEHIDKGDEIETYGLIRFIKPTGRGMMGNKYLKWLNENLGGLEFELAERVLHFYRVHESMMTKMFGDDVPLNELPCTYKIGFVEYKPTDKIYPTSVLRIPFMFFDEGQSVCIPAYGNQSVELSPLGFSVFVNAISNNVYTSFVNQEKYKDKSVVHEFGLGSVNKEELHYWDNFLRITSINSGIFSDSESTNLWKIFD